MKGAIRNAILALLACGAAAAWAQGNASDTERKIAQHVGLKSIAGDRQSIARTLGDIGKSIDALLVCGRGQLAGCFGVQKRNLCSGDKPAAGISNDPC